MAKEKKDTLTPKVQSEIARAEPKTVRKHDYVGEPMKLELAKKYVTAEFPTLTGEERFDAIKARYIELKGRINGEPRYKNGMKGKGTPRPTSKAAMAYDGIEDDDTETETDSNGISITKEALGSRGFGDEDDDD